MKFYDISIPLQKGMPFWPGDNEPLFEQYLSVKEGSSTNSTRMQTSVHLGTHVDAPSHIYSNMQAVDKIPLEILMGPAAVLEFNETDELSREVLQSVEWPDTERILFKTSNSQLWKQPVHKFEPQFVSLTKDGAEFLMEKNVRLVGIDYLSIDLFRNEDLKVHKVLLKNKVVVVEGLNLYKIQPGKYELICLPLKIVGSDGAPARAVLKSY